MRRTVLLSSVALVAATFHAGAASAGDRYGPPEPVKPVTVSATDWNGPLLSWTNKAVADSAPLTVAKPAAKPAAIQPLRAAPAQALPTSLYAPTPAATAAASTPALAPTGYQPAHPTGEVLTLSLADLPPPGPSLERQQAAEEDAAVLAAKIARADALAAKDIAAGKPVTGGNTDLLGGP